MNVTALKQTFALIKVVSTVLITGAVGLEAWHLYTVFTADLFFSRLVPFLWLGRFVVVAHLIEAIVAAIYAPSQQKSALTYGIYTFFVGTVGLAELFDQGE